jgi:hypothetical protein
MNTPVRNEALDTISFFVSRDFQDDEIELAVEVLDYIPEHENGGCADEKRGPDVSLGNAWTVPGGKYVELTPLESEAAQEYALKIIESRPTLEEVEVL